MPVTSRLPSPGLNPQRSTRSVSDHHLLRLGASGSEVTQLQRALTAAGIQTAVTGRFDARTEQAVRRYQSAQGLEIDGKVGQQTWGSFLGQTYRPGANLLASASRRSGSTPARPGAGDVFEGGSTQRGTAYVNGRPRTIALTPVGNGESLRPDAARAFRAMQAAARRDGVRLGATSGFRTMGEQQQLYRRYLSGRGNLAARPGYSNHQNGIAMDVSGVGGRGTAADRWLRRNAARFGFRNLPSEYWHYDYFG